MPEPLTHELASGPFDTQPRLTQIAMAVDPVGLIAEMVCPRVPTAYKFAYTKHSVGDRLSIPSTMASRASLLNEIEFGSSDVVDQTLDYGLIDPVPARDMDEAVKSMAAVDPLADATMALAGLIKLDREKRVADLVTTAANYAANYSATLAGNSQWDNDASNPVDAILERMDVPLVRPNTLVVGQEVWTKLRQHAKVVEATKLSGAGDQASGAVMAKAVAELFELDYVLIGRTQYQTANRGQPEVFDYVWGKHAALLHINRTVNSTKAGGVMPTFCFTAEAQEMMVGTYLAPERGIGAGSTVVKVSESCKEVVSWDTAGYLWRNAVA